MLVYSVIASLDGYTADAEGKFDPHVHEALSQQPSEHPEGTIVEVWQRGYRLGDRVARPARVVVSSGNEDEANR